MKTCYIENDHFIDEEVEGYYMVSFLNDVGIEKSSSDINEYFDLIVTGAYQNQDKVISAIRECDAIFIYTSFIGASKYLFCYMAKYVLEQEDIRDKYIVNFVTNEHLNGLDSEMVDLVNRLRDEKNIVYMDREDDRIDELVCMIKGEQP